MGLKQTLESSSLLILFSIAATCSLEWRLIMLLLNWQQLRVDQINAGSSLVALLICHTRNHGTKMALSDYIQSIVISYSVVIICPGSSSGSSLQKSSFYAAASGGRLAAAAAGATDAHPGPRTHHSRPPHPASRPMDESKAAPRRRDSRAPFRPRARSSRRLSG